jgi:hypothetical protein
LGGGTLISDRPAAPFDTYQRWAEQLEVPLGVVGLGVDPVSDRGWPAVEALLDRARFFYVRDRKSRALLHDHPKVRVAPDLSFASPLQGRSEAPHGVGEAPICGLNLRRSASGGLDPEPWLETLKHLPVAVKGIPLSSFEGFDEGALLQEAVSQCPERFDPALYQDLDLMIGTAFHSVLFAVQATVPVIAIGYAPKVFNFMADNGLSRYVLAPDEHARLPALVDEVLAESSAITESLQTLRGKLNREAKSNVKAIREEIESSGPRRRGDGPKTTVVVLSSGDGNRDERTQASCVSQTYSDLEIVIVGAGPQGAGRAQLDRALAQSSGEYVTWIDGGDWFAEDGVGCLVARLEENPDWDVVYADYYAMSATGYPVGHHKVPGPNKLYRRDVVGPCFLMRRDLLPLLDREMPLLSYGLWLRASSRHTLVPVHAPLFYSQRPIKSDAFIARERQVRRRWRRTRPLWERLLWHVIDSDFGERFLVKPLAYVVRLFERKSYAKRV